jgi:PKD repeat protein
MTCTIVIYSISGLIPSGGAGPTALRITGKAFSCPAVSVSSSVTGSSGVIAISPNNGFDVTLPLTTPVACGELVSAVTVKCIDNACFATMRDFQLECCRITINILNGFAAFGLHPTDLSITGTAFGCPGDHVVVATSITAGATTVAVDPVTGTYIANLKIPMTVACDTPVDITVSCAQDPACRRLVTLPLNCPDCLRAALTYTASPCINGAQPVTLSGTVMLPAGSTLDLRWDYGDPLSPALSPPFTVDNSGGTATTPHVVQSPPHSYPPGNYTAYLRPEPPIECDPVPIDVTTSCGSCPTISSRTLVGPCMADETSPNQGCREVTFELTSFTPPLPPAATATVSWAYGGPDCTGATTAVTTVTGVPHTHKAYFQHRPAGYTVTAFVSIVDSTGALVCSPPIAVKFALPSTTAPPAVNVDPCLPCPDKVSVNRQNPASPPLPSPHEQFVASIAWPAGTLSPPTPTGLDWVVTLPGATGQAAPQARSHTPLVPGGPIDVIDTTSAGQWTGDAAAIMGGAVNLTAGGNYAVGATAKFPFQAGLPTNPDGTTVCNLTGSTSFTIPTKVSCAQITGINVSVPGCAAPAGGVATELTASVTNSSGVLGSYEWDFGDPASGVANTTTTSVPTAQHTFGAPGNYAVTLTIHRPASCPPTTQTATSTVSISACPCPEGQHRDASGKCVPDTPPTPPTPPVDIGCCVLIIAWGVAHIATGIALYFNFWWLSLALGIVATILLGLWIGLCCWPCAIRFWTCCTLLGWQFVFNSILTGTLYGLLAGANLPGNPAVVAAFTAATAVFALLLGITRCPFPNPLFPPQWPPCRCP